jgi:hypothetical protein
MSKRLNNVRTCICDVSVFALLVACLMKLECAAKMCYRVAV